MEEPLRLTHPGFSLISRRAGFAALSTAIMADEQHRGKDSHPKKTNAWIVAAGLLCVAGSIVYGFREFGIRSKQQVDAINAQTVVMQYQGQRKIYDEKMAVYKQVAEAASKIAALKAEGGTPAQMQDAVAQFKTLAWGPAAISEGRDSSEAMQLFNRALDAGADAGQLQQLSLDLAKVCGHEAEEMFSGVVREGLTGHMGNPVTSPLLREMNEIVRGPESRQAAEQWLSLVDGGLFVESWKSASAYFQATVPQERWVRAIGVIRQPFGNVM
jgi:hypothetical protein